MQKYLLASSKTTSKFKFDDSRVKYRRSAKRLSRKKRKIKIHRLSTKKISATNQRRLKAVAYLFDFFAKRIGWNLGQFTVKGSIVIAYDNSYCNNYSNCIETCESSVILIRDKWRSTDFSETKTFFGSLLNWFSGNKDLFFENHLKSTETVPIGNKFNCSFPLPQWTSLKKCSDEVNLHELVNAWHITYRTHINLNLVITE